jgi:hypothetical protein
VTGSLLLVREMVPAPMQARPAARLLEAHASALVIFAGRCSHLIQTRRPQPLLRVRGVSGLTAVEVQALVDAHAGRTDNPHHVTAQQVGADPAGTAASLMAAHLAAPDPHPQYLTEAELEAALAARREVYIDETPPLPFPAISFTQVPGVPGLYDLQVNCP